MHEEIAFFKEKQDDSSKNEGLFVNDLKKENETFRKKKVMSLIVLKFINGQKILNNLPNFQKCVFDKGGISYKPNLKQRFCKNYFVKATLINDQNICHYCNSNGYMIYRCLVKRNAYYAIKCI